MAKTAQLKATGMFDWNDLRYFLELARLGRLGPAARRLGVDHTTVGRRIAELEKALSTKLFDRTESGFVLTDAGHRLLAYAETMENNALAVAEKAGQPETLTGTVRVATMEGIASFYMAERLSALHAHHPDITVELVTSTQLLNLTKREADISLSFVSPAGSRLIVRKVGRFDVRLYGAPSYLREHGTPKTPADLKDHAFVDYIDDLVQIAEVRWLLDAIPHPHVVFRSTSMVSQQNAAAAGIGLVVLPSFLGARDKRLKPLLVDHLSIKRDLWLSVHEDLRHMARVKAVRDFIKELIERDQAFLDGVETAQ